MRRSRASRQAALQAAQASASMARHMRSSCAPSRPKIFTRPCTFFRNIHIRQRQCISTAQSHRRSIADEQHSNEEREWNSQCLCEGRLRRALCVQLISSDLSCPGSRCSAGGRAWLLVEMDIVVVLFTLDQQACILSTRLHAAHTTKLIQPPPALIVRPVRSTRGSTAAWTPAVTSRLGTVSRATHPHSQLHRFSTSTADSPAHRRTCSTATTPAKAAARKLEVCFALWNR